MKPIKNNNSAFTLLELLVVLAIIAILATAGLVSYNGTMKRTRNTRRKADLHSLQLAIEQYRTVNGNYPTTGGSWWGDPTGYGSHTSDYVPGIVPQFIQALPHDPNTNTSYSPCNDASQTGYLYKSDGTDYKLLAHCTPEDDYPPGGTNQYYDPIRPTWAWQVSSSGGTNW